MFSADLDSVRSAPGAYEAVQVVRLLERHLWSSLNQSVDHGNGGTAPHGLQIHPNIRFFSQASLAFPVGEISAIAPVASETDDSESRWEVEVSFFGLTGPQGVLPLHRCALLLGAGNTSRPAIRDLLRILDHRMIALFLAAWERSRHIHCFERATRQRPNTDDAFTTSFRALVGSDPRHSQPQPAISPNLPIFFAGLLADAVRPATGLQRMLTHVLGMATKVTEFVGEWLEIPLEKQSRLSIDEDESAQIDRICLGRATWSVQDRFRIELGPIDYATFLRLTPGHDLYAAVVEIARRYAGCQFLIEIQPLLAATEVPQCHLRPEAGMQLGINTWLQTKTPTEPARDVIFKHRGADETPEIRE